MVKASGPHNTEGSIMVKASGPHNTEGSVTVIQNLEHTKISAMAGPVSTTGQISRFNFLKKETSSIFFTGTKVQLAHLDTTIKSESRYRASAASVDEAGHLTTPPSLLQHFARTFDLQQSS